MRHQLEEDIKTLEDMDNEDEGYKNSDSLCPVCGYPTVREYGLEVCYHCGWSEGDEPEGYYEE